MVIQSNIPAINAHRNLSMNNGGLSKTLEKLSSGYRINRAADDAAGLAISEKMRSQIRGLSMAEQNVSNAINLIQTAEGALNETHAILQRMRELAVQSSNGTYTQQDRGQITLEYRELMEEIDRIAQSTAYNTMKLFEHIDFVRVDGTNADFLAWGGLLMGHMGNGQPNDGVWRQGAHNGTFTFATNYAAKMDLLIGIDGTPQALTLLETDPRVSVTITSPSSFVIRENGTSTFVEYLISPLQDFPPNFAGGITNLGVNTNGPGDISFIPASVAFWEIDDITPEFTFQIGANGSADQRITMRSRGVSCAALGIDGSSVATRPGANGAILLLDGAIADVSSFRAYIGSFQNRLEHTLGSLGVSRENLTAAESTIRDADMAKEMMKFTQQSVLVQAAQAMLAQANALPQGVLGLLS